MGDNQTIPGLTSTSDLRKKIIFQMNSFLMKLISWPLTNLNKSKVRVGKYTWGCHHPYAPLNPPCPSLGLNQHQILDEKLLRLTGKGFWKVFQMNSFLDEIDFMILNKLQQEEVWGSQPHVRQTKLDRVQISRKEGHKFKGISTKDLHVCSSLSPYLLAW